MFTIACCLVVGLGSGATSLRYGVIRNANL